jgi:hypothetical protein
MIASMSDALQRLIDEREAAEVVVRLFVATDRRDWAGVEACLAPRLILDMTSMSGGQPLQTTGAEVAASWAEGLRPIDRVHHQIGNLVVTVSGGEASASAYGIAFHHRKVESPRRTRVFVGSYDLHLVRSDGRWRIDRFAFDLAFMEGNPELEKAT